MTSEELAKKHSLNVDLTKPDFWQAGIDQVPKRCGTIRDFSQLKAM